MLKKSLIMLVPLFLAGATFYWFPRPKSEGRNFLTAEVQRGRFTAKITETGELRALRSFTASAQKGLPIIYLAPEGTNVKKGDLLVRFDSGKYAADLEATQARVEVETADLRKAEMNLEAKRHRLMADIGRYEAEVRLAQLDLDELRKKPLKADIERAQLELEKEKVAFDNAEKTRNLLPKLVEKGFITKDSLDKAELGYLKAKMNLQVARVDFEKVSAGATPHELERVKIKLHKAEVALKRAQNAMGSELESYKTRVVREKANLKRARKLIKKAEVKMGYSELRAPRNGLVVYARINEKSGEKVQLGMIPFEGQPLIYLPDVTTMVVDAEINEIDLGKIKLGGSVEVKPDAYPGTVFPGAVHEIGTLAKFKRNPSGTASAIKVFDVTVIIEQKDSRLKPGLSATLDFIIDRQEDVLFIPLAAVDSRRGDPVVFVSNTGKVEERKVELGTSNQNRVIVKKGLRRGEQVVLGPQFSQIP